MASLPVTRFLVRSPRCRSAGCPSACADDDPQSVVVRFFDSTGADISEDAQRKIERLFQREDYRRVLPEEIGDIAFPPRALEDYTVALESTVDISAIADRQFKLVVDYGYGATSFVMPNVLAKLGADVLAVNPYASTSRHRELRPRRARPSGSPASSARRAPTSVPCFDPDGERLTLIDDEGARPHRHRGAAGVACELVCDHLLGDRIALPVNVTDARRRAWPPPTACTSGRPSCRPPALADAATEPGVGFAADGEGGFILPGFLPAFDAAAAFVKMLDLLARAGRRLSAVVASAAPRAPGARDGGHAVGAEGSGHAHARGAGQPRAGAGRRREGAPRRRLGAGPARTRDEPITHVWAEAGSDTDARRLAQEYVRRIRQLLR